MKPARPAKKPLPDVTKKPSAKVERQDPPAASVPLPEFASVVYDFEAARAKNETHKANLSEMEERKRAGELCETALVVKYLTDVSANFRTALERISDKLADRLAAETDAHACHQMLTGEINQALAQLEADCAAAADRLQEGDRGRA